MNCQTEGCKNDAAQGRGLHCWDCVCAYKGCPNRREQDVYCLRHIDHLEVIEWHAKRVAEGMTKYGMHGGILRDAETLELLPSASKTRRVSNKTKPTPLDESPIVAQTPAEKPGTADAPPTAITTETTPVVAPEPPPPRVKPKAERAKRERPPQAPPSVCRTPHCYNAIFEMGLCRGCCSLFLVWRRYALVGEASPITPNAEQLQTFQRLQSELQGKTGT